MDYLTKLENQFGSDKGTEHFNRHYYTRVYAALFGRIHHQPVRLLEIGLLHVADSGWVVPCNYVGTAVGDKAPSLNMWSTYFPNGRVFGFDINDFGSVQVERCQIFRGDMSSRPELE